METTKRIDTDTLEDLRNKARLLRTAIDGLLAQTKVGEPAESWETKFLPVQELSWEVDRMAREIY